MFSQPDSLGYGNECFHRLIAWATGMKCFHRLIACATGMKCFHRLIACATKYDTNRNDLINI